MSTSEENNKEALDPNKTLLVNKVIQELICKHLQREKSKSEETERHACVCASCSAKNFKSYRYKCLVCSGDYNLCSICFESRNVSKTHAISHPTCRFDKPGELYGEKCDDESKLKLAELVDKYKNELHEEIACNMCKSSPIRGIRFKCDKCSEFNICYQCYAQKKSVDKHSADHPCIAIGKTISLRVDSSRIELLERIGAGGFGVVYKAKLMPDNKLVACKIIKCELNKDDSADGFNDPTIMVMLYKSYLRELKAYNEIQGVNVLKLIAYSEEKVETTLKLFLMTEFMSKGSLSDLIKKEGATLSYRRRLDLAVHVACGMSRMHSMGFIHKDIRPDNILVDERYVAKIGDMGIAKVFDESQTQHSLIGCVPYMPPEFYSGKYNQKLDVYTFGLTLVELFGGAHKLYRKEKLIKIETETPILWHFVKQCVDNQPTIRPTAKEIEHVLRFFNDLAIEVISKNFADYISYSCDKKNFIFKTIYEMFLQKYLNITSQANVDIVIVDEDDLSKKSVADVKAKPLTTDFDDGKESKTKDAEDCDNNKRISHSVADSHVSIGIQAATNKDEEKFKKKAKCCFM
jgi:serine/threonine protein kinase